MHWLKFAISLTSVCTELTADTLWVPHIMVLWSEAYFRPHPEEGVWNRPSFYLCRPSMIRSYSVLSSIGVMQPSGHEEKIAYRPFSPSKACSTSCELLMHHLLASGRKGINITLQRHLFSKSALGTYGNIRACKFYTLLMCKRVIHTPCCTVWPQIFYWNVSQFTS